LPSDEAQARIAPRSWGAQATELTGKENERTNAVVQKTTGTGSGVQRMLLDSGPTELAAWRLIFLPNEDSAVIRAGSEN
jgi:hypothetical protein